MMLKRILFSIVSGLLSLTIAESQAQKHPWRTVDRGGGRSAGAGLTLTSTIGQPTAHLMNDSVLSLEGGYIPGLRFLSGTATSTENQAGEGWNMVSVPLLVSDYRKASLYPTAASNAFAYEGSYQERDTLENGTGYWLKYNSASTLQFTGTVIPRETVGVTHGWNMVGTPSYPVLVTDIAPVSPTVLASNFFGYTGASGYFTEDTLRPGRAYWIKVDNTGQLILSAGSVSIAGATALQPVEENGAGESANTLTISDNSRRTRTLFFSSSGQGIDLTKFELPPPPPAGTLDIRYSSNRRMETAERGRSKEAGIHISAALYPLTICWQGRDEAELMIDGKVVSLKGTGSTTVTNPETVIKLHLFPSHSLELPKAFALHQNYPNPFNPSTTLRYDLPKAAHVVLTVYNTLGQHVTTLVDEVQEAGFKTVTCDGAHVASGVYFYKLVAGDFAEVRKMTIIR